MPVIRCSWTNCNSDVSTKQFREKTITVYRYSENGFFKKNTLTACVTPAEGKLDFYQIPRPKRCAKSNEIIPDHHSTIVCKNWIEACNRFLNGDGYLNIEKIKYHHFICSKHFKEGKPTRDFPNPESWIDSAIPTIDSEAHNRSLQCQSKRLPTRSLSQSTHEKTTRKRVRKTDIFLALYSLSGY